MVSCTEVLSHFPFLALTVLEISRKTNFRTWTEDIMSRLVSGELCERKGTNGFPNVFCSLPTLLDLRGIYRGFSRKPHGGCGFFRLFSARLAKIKTHPLGLFTSFRPWIIFPLRNQPITDENWLLVVGFFSWFDLSIKNPPTQCFFNVIFFPWKKLKKCHWKTGYAREKNEKSAFEKQILPVKISRKTKLWTPDGYFIEKIDFQFIKQKIAHP